MRHIFVQKSRRLFNSRFGGNTNVSLSAMDQEKPQALSPRTYDYSTGDMSHSTAYSDLQHGRATSIVDIDAPEQMEERRERRGDNLW